MCAWSFPVWPDLPIHVSTEGGNCFAFVDYLASIEEKKPGQPAVQNFWMPLNTVIPSIMLFLIALRFVTMLFVPV